MNLQTIFGRYISRDSVVHRMDPRAKLLLSVLFMVVVFAAQSYVALAVAAVFTFGMFFFAKISIKQAFVSIAPLAILVVFTGLSGSGKSSLAFDTIYADGPRRYMESLS